MIPVYIASLSGKLCLRGGTMPWPVRAALFLTEFLAVILFFKKKATKAPLFVKESLRGVDSE